MSIVSKPTIHDYWNNSQLFRTPEIRYIMSRDRFYQILKNFKMGKKLMRVILHINFHFFYEFSDGKFTKLIYKILYKSLTINDAMIKFSAEAK